MCNPAKKMIFPELSVENAKFLRDHIKKNLGEIVFTSYLMILALFFFNLEPYRLFIGGILFISLGIKYFVSGVLHNTPGESLLGLLSISIGILALFTKNLLVMGIDAFVFFSLFLALLLLLFYSFTENQLKSSSRVFGFFILVFMTASSFIVVKPLINTIHNLKEWNPWFYLSSIIFILLINFLYFKIVEGYFKLVKVYRPYIALTFSLIIFVLHSGYFLLRLESENTLLNFLKLISITFVTIPIVVSAIKSIFSKSHRALNLSFKSEGLKRTI